MAMEEVREIPSGWVVVGGVGNYKKPFRPNPTPQHNFRGATAGAELHEMLESGTYSREEIVAKIQSGEVKKLSEGNLDRLLNDYKDYQHMGWYLLQDTNSKYHIVYRDPVTSYAVEHKLEGEMATAEPKAPPKPRSASTPVKSTPEAPKTGPFVQSTTAYVSRLEAAGLKGELVELINKYVKDEEYPPQSRNARDIVLQTIDDHGVNGVDTLNQIAILQKDTKILPGFYRELRQVDNKLTQASTAVAS